MVSEESLKYISSSIGTAIATKTSVSPLTRVKVLQQIQFYHSTQHYNSFINSFKYIYKQEGFRGFFKGNMVNIYKSVPNYCLKFPLNDLYINRIISKTQYSSIRELPFNELLKAGIFTGIIQTSCTYPIDLVRTRITQDANMLKQKVSMSRCFIDTIKNEGAVGLYRGFSPAIMTTPIYIGLQLSCFQYFRNQDNIFSNSLIAGATAGFISQGIMYPGDTVKRQLQINGMNNHTQYNGLTECIINIYKKQGLGGFYKGIMLNSIKSIPEIAIKFTIYEYIKEQIH